MTGTNVDYYAAGFDAAGHRIVSKIVFFRPAEIQKRRQSSGALGRCQGNRGRRCRGRDHQRRGLRGISCRQIRGENGKPVEYIPPEPTDEEKAASAAASIAAKYNPQLSALKDNLVTAVLTGDEELQAEIKEEYAELMAEYNNELEALQNG